MPCLLDNLRLLEAAQGYAALGLYIQANRELEQMSSDTRHWPEALAVKLAIFDGLKLWEMVEIIAAQLQDYAQSSRAIRNFPRRLPPGLLQEFRSRTP